MPLLDVPHVTQNGNGIWNDCGPASLSQVIQYVTGKTVSILQLILSLGISLVSLAMGKLISVEEMQKMAAKFDVTLESHNVTLPNLTPLLEQGKPCICLVNYANVPDRVKTSSFKGNHWLVLTGIDSKVHYNDPLYQGDVTVEKWEWNRMYLNIALAPSVGYLPRIEAPVQFDDSIQVTYKDNDMETGEFLKHFVPAEVYQRRLMHKLLKCYIAKTGVNDSEIGMFAEDGHLAMIYPTMQDLYDFGWRDKDLELGKNWVL